MTAAEFRAARAILQLTQAELAVMLCRRVAALSSWETGRHRVPKVAELAVQQLLDIYKRAES